MEGHRAGWCVWGWLGVPICLPVWAQLQYNLFLFPLPGQVILGYQELLAQEFLCMLIQSGEIWQPLMWALPWGEWKLDKVY